MRTLYTLLTALLLFLSLSHSPDSPATYAVGFDLDDTIAASSPAFSIGFDSDVAPFSPAFWAIVNDNPEACTLIRRTMSIIYHYQRLGHPIYIITARKGYNGAVTADYFTRLLGIPTDHFYYASPKTEHIRRLNIAVFYGDSDSDITDALEAGAVPVRTVRPASSTYTAKNNPGMYGELVIP